MDINIHYAHLNHKFSKNLGISRYTVAINLPDKEELFDFMVNNLDLGVNTFEIGIGFTKVHPNDQYNKAVGRDLALSRMSVLSFEFNSLVVRDGRHVYTFFFQSDEGDYIEIEFTTVPHSEFVKVENVHISGF